VQVIPEKEIMIMDEKTQLNLEQKTVWTIEELSIYSGYKISYLRKLCSKGKIKYYIPEFGRRVFFKSKEMIAWLTHTATKTRDEIINSTKFQIKH